MEHITSISYRNYKTFRQYSVSINEFNILVGPNNSGKSTIIGSLKILAEALRKARARNPVFVKGPDGSERGYVVDLSNVPVATENIFYNYDDTTPAKVTFRLSNNTKLLLYFPERDVCLMIPETSGKQVTTTSQFKKQFDITIGFVPILGPVEHNEQLYQNEAARLALITHKAARNFRNIWYHYPDEFDEFREQLIATWPGMDIQRPEPSYTPKKPLLHMFCPEDRIPREIFWAGFGFQVWCQMLTFIVKNKNVSLFLIDEPDIYLHSDLQRQLLTLLKNLGPDILIATHSTEIITEADPDDILLINKRALSAKRLKDPSQLKVIFGSLGSNLNPIMTQLAKTKRALFVEGKDFQILSQFARLAGFNETANRSDFAVIPAEGFNPQKVKYYLQGIEVTLGHSITSAVVFDRDYRSKKECKIIKAKLNNSTDFVHILERKEIENYLLTPAILQRAIGRRIARTKNRKVDTFRENVKELLLHFTDKMKADVFGQFSSHQWKAIKSQQEGVHDSTINKQLMVEFENVWNDYDARLWMVPGKKLLAMLNTHLTEKYGISLTPSLIISSHKKGEIPAEMISLLDEIEKFRSDCLPT
jgi:energy-coupling factor transporter ATP-binding protein EcfA2